MTPCTAISEETGCIGYAEGAHLAVGLQHHMWLVSMSHPVQCAVKQYLKRLLALAMQKGMQKGLILR